MRVQYNVRATWRRTVARNSLILLTFQNFYYLEFKSAMHSTFNTRTFPQQTSCARLLHSVLSASEIFNFRRFKEYLLSLSFYLVDFTRFISDTVIIFQLQKRLTLICIVASVTVHWPSSLLLVTTNLLPLVPRKNHPWRFITASRTSLIEIYALTYLFMIIESHLFCDTKYHLEILIFEISLNQSLTGWSYS